MNWFNCDTPINDSRITEIETALLIRFPRDYREIVRQFHGGTPSKKAFTVIYRKGKMTSCLAVLLSFTPDRSENILRTNALLRDQLAPGLICIGEDGGGDFICFDYGANNVDKDGLPAVVYWHHETDEISFLNASFTGFLEMLR
jgi:hypothetical protein